MQKRTIILFLLLSALTLTACAPAPEFDISVTPADIKFNRERAFAVETEFATTFTNRHSNTSANLAATEWIRSQFKARGWTCSYDEWEATLYSEIWPLRNVVCSLKGQQPQEILVVAHHDQAPTTIQGANNDASGIAILLELAEIFAAEGPPAYGLVFVATDAEEWGMLGARRFVQTHPNPDNFIAGFSLDNLGRPYHDGVDIEQLGQARDYGRIWVPLLAQESGRAAGAQGDLHLRLPIDQMIDQAAPISFMDQGPMVAAGIPAIGLTGRIPATTRPVPDKECRERPDVDNYVALDFELWHSPEDTMDCQSAAALATPGIIAEATLRQLLSMESFPQESGPYVYLDSSRRVLRGAPLWAIFLAFTAVWFIGSLLVNQWPLRETWANWGKILPHFLGLWVPLIGGVLLLYLFTKIWPDRLLLDFELFPATTKDPYNANPRWLPLILFLGDLAVFFYLGRLSLRGLADKPRPAFRQLKSFGLLVVGLVAVFILVRNPFSLLILIPPLFWFLISGRSGIGRVLDIVLFLLGGGIIYAMVYLQGFTKLHLNWAFLWMMLNMIAIQSFGFVTMLASTAVTAAGLLLIVRPVGKNS
jgi:hypothetical protein